jgi:antitoxin component YwqK of YwqJK toxin-antitoxin module
MLKNFLFALLTFFSLTAFNQEHLDASYAFVPYVTSLDQKVPEFVSYIKTNAGLIEPDEYYELIMAIANGAKPEGFMRQDLKDGSYRISNSYSKGVIDIVDKKVTGELKVSVYPLVFQYIASNGVLTKFELYVKTEDNELIKQAEFRLVNTRVYESERDKEGKWVEDVEGTDVTEELSQLNTTSDANEVPDGYKKIEEKDDDGNLELTGYLNEKYKQEGEWTFYYPSGKVEHIETYSNGVLNGTFKALFENGNTKRKGAYKNGQQVGYWREYHPNGQLKILAQFSNGEKSGVWKYYDEEGNLTETKDYN